MHRGLEPKFESMDRSEGEAQPLLNKAGIRASGMAGKKFSTFRNHEQLEPDYSDGRVKRRARPSPFPERKSSNDFLSHPAVFAAFATAADRSSTRSNRLRHNDATSSGVVASRRSPPMDTPLGGGGGVYTA